MLIQSQIADSQNVSDSLTNLLHNTKDESVKVKLLLKLSKNEEISNPAKSLEYSELALKLAKEIDFDSAEVRSLILIGSNLCRLNKLNEAIEIGEQIIKRAEKEDMQLEIADGRSIMAVAYAQGGDFDNSSKLYFENLKLFEKLGEKRLLASTLGNIGADFIEIGKYDKALEYIEKSIEILIEIDNKKSLSDQYNNLSAIYYTGFNKKIIALEYLKKALNLAIQIDDYQQQITTSLNISGIYLEDNNFDSSLYYQNISLNLLNKISNKKLFSDCYLTVSKYYLLLHKIDSAMIYALKSFTIAEEQQDFQAINKSSEIISEIYLIENDSSKAFHYYKIFTASKDSLTFYKNKNELFKIEFLYNQEKLFKEQEIKQLRNSIIFSAIAIFLLFLFIISFLLYSKQKIINKNVILEKNNAENDLSFKTKELSINLISLAQKNEFIIDLVKNIGLIEKKDFNEIKPAIRALLQKIKNNSDDKLIQEFSIQFNEANNKFYDNILEKYPDLTQNELKLCAFLSINMSSKEISSLTGQSIQAIERARYRLRKKLDLSNPKDNLSTFLMQFK